MLYTSYFANASNLPESVARISIALYPPRWFSCARFPKLAPTKEILSRWKENHNEAEYRLAFAVMLARLDVKEVAQELSGLANGNDVVLLCYEKRGDFCHRHLVAEWFRSNGIHCKEYD